MAKKAEQKQLPKLVSCDGCIYLPKEDENEVLMYCLKSKMPSPRKRLKHCIYKTTNKNGNITNH